MWEINSKHWGQVTVATKQIKFVWEAFCGFIRPFRILAWRSPATFQSSSKESDGKLNINMTKCKSFAGGCRCGQGISPSPGDSGQELWLVEVLTALQSRVYLVWRCFSSLICCSGWVSDTRRLRGSGHFYQRSCHFVLSSTFWNNTTKERCPDERNITYRLGLVALASFSLSSISFLLQ